MSPLEHIREICLALPEAEERETWGEQTFRVRQKIFAMGHEDAISCKAPPGAQETLIGSNPERFFRPAYVGSKGWIGINFDDSTDWDEVAFLVRQSYEMTAPKQLVAVWHAQSAGSAE